MDTLTFNSRPAIQIANLAFSYPGDRTHHIVLENLNLEVAHGEFVALVGQSGVGKSTLLRVIAGLVPAAQGSVSVLPATEAESRPIGMVFQDARLLPWRSVIGNVEYGLEGLVKSPAVRRRRALDALELVGLRDYTNRWPYQLSGGQRQRVGLARALAVRPSLLLMDEPFASLDTGTRHGLQDQLLNISRETDTSIIFVTHDIAEASYLADRVLVLAGSPAHIVRELVTDRSQPRQRRERMRDASNAEMHDELYRMLAGGTVSTPPKPLLYAA